MIALMNGLILIIWQFCRNNCFYEVPFLVNKIRSLLNFLIYAKIAKISQYTAKSQELHKVTNIISNDFNSI